MHLSRNPDPASRQLLCEAHGVSFAIETASSELLRRASVCLPHGTVLQGKAPGGQITFRLQQNSGASAIRLLREDELLVEEDCADTVLEQLTRTLMIHVAEHSPAHVFVHAGVVALGTRCLMLPGTSFAGKTTLVAALVQAGAAYYSDEYAVLDREGLVHPYARDLQVRLPGRPEQRGVPPSSLGAVPATSPMRVTHVLFARYVPGAVWAPQPVSPGLAVLELLRHSIPVQRTPARVLSTLDHLLRGATAWTSQRDSVQSVVPRVLQALRTGGPLQ